MNQRFDFLVIVQPAPGTRTPPGELNPEQELQLSATGSQETRARRRMLAAVYDAGCTARHVTCIGSAPVK